MCKGIYNTSPCELFAEAVIGIGSPAPMDARTINFLVDTGATGTLINAVDATRLGLTYDSQGRPRQDSVLLPRAEDALGIGGQIPTYRLDNVFLTLISHGINESERHTEYIESLSVADPQYQYESLMGMDLLKRFNLLIDSEALTVNFVRIPVRGTSYLVQHS